MKIESVPAAILGVGPFFQCDFCGWEQVLSSKNTPRRQYIPGNPSTTLYLYDSDVLEHGCLQLDRLMNRALTGGFGAGTSLALGLRLLDRLDQPFVPFPEPLICPERGQLDLHLPSLVIGVVLGFCILPIIEALLAFRLWIYRASLRRLAWFGEGPVRSRSSYKLL